MIIKLPVCIDDKILYMNFILEKMSPNNLQLKIFNKNYETKIQRIKVPLCNNFEGITYLDLFFPLNFHFINDKVIFNNFFQKIFLSQNNLAIDFFISLEKYIESEYKYNFLRIDDLVKFEKFIWEYWNNYNDEITITNNLETVKTLWDTVQLY